MINYDLCYSCRYYEYKNLAYCTLFKRNCQDLKKECTQFVIHKHYQKVNQNDKLRYPLSRQ